MLQPALFAQAAVNRLRHETAVTHAHVPVRPEISLHLPVGGHFFTEDALEQLGSGVEEDRFGHKRFYRRVRRGRGERQNRIKNSALSTFSAVRFISRRCGCRVGMAHPTIIIDEYSGGRCPPYIAY